MSLEKILVEDGKFGFILGSLSILCFILLIFIGFGNFDLDTGFLAYPILTLLGIGLGVTGIKISKGAKNKTKLSNYGLIISIIGVTLPLILSLWILYIFKTRGFHIPW